MGILSIIFAEGSRIISAKYRNALFPKNDIISNLGNRDLRSVVRYLRKRQRAQTAMCPISFGISTKFGRYSFLTKTVQQLDLAGNPTRLSAFNVNPKKYPSSYEV